MIKICTKCKKEKDINEFTNLRKNSDKKRAICKECEREYARLYNKKTNNMYSKKYEKTINGFIMRTYRNMKSRILGIQKKKYHLYKDLEILNKDEFYEWTKNNNDFLYLFKNWKDSNYIRKLTPSIDRIDSTKGYIIDNMRWVIFSDNCKNIQKLQSNNTSGYRGISFDKEKNKWIAQINHNKKHIFLGYFNNIDDAIDKYNKKAVELFGKFAYINIKK